MVGKLSDVSGRCARQSLLLAAWKPLSSKLGGDTLLKTCREVFASLPLVGDPRDYIRVILG